MQKRNSFKTTHCQQHGVIYESQAGQKFLRTWGGAISLETNRFYQCKVLDANNKLWPMTPRVDHAYKFSQVKARR